KVRANGPHQGGIGVDAILARILVPVEPRSKPVRDILTRGNRALVDGLGDLLEERLCDRVIVPELEVALDLPVLAHRAASGPPCTLDRLGDFPCAVRLEELVRPHCSQTARSKCPNPAPSTDESNTPPASRRSSWGTNGGRSSKDPIQQPAQEVKKLP